MTEKMAVSGQRFDCVDFSGQDLSERVFENCRFEECNFDHANLNRASFKGCTFDNASCLDMTAWGTDFSDTYFIATHFRFCDLKFSCFSNSYLRKSRFLCSDLRGTDFLLSTLYETNIDLTYTDFLKHFDTVKTTLGGATTEEVARYRNSVLSSVSRTMEMVDQDRGEWAKQWLEKVQAGEWDRTQAFQGEKPYLKELADKAKQKETTRQQGKDQTDHEYRHSLTTAIKEHIDMLDYLRAEGYHPYRIGKQWGVREFSSMRIFPSRKDPDRLLFHHHASDTKGSVIDLCMYLEKKNQDQAIKKLRSMLPTGRELAFYNKVAELEKTKAAGIERPPLELPKPTKEKYQRVYAYLTKSRGITPEVVSDMVDRKLLYEDQRHNAVFVGYDKDNEPGYACKRGTLTVTDTPYKGDADGSRKEVGQYIDNGSRFLVVTEASIDNMSIMSNLQRSKIDFKSFDYLALGSTSTQAIQYHWDKIKSADTVLIGTDLDNGGMNCRLRLHQKLKDQGFQGIVQDQLPVTKDFNQDLKQGRKFDFSHFTAHLSSQKNPLQRKEYKHEIKQSQSQFRGRKRER